MSTNYTIDYKNFNLTIAKNGDVVFSKDFYYEPVHDRIQGVYDALFEYTNIPEEELERVLDEVVNFGFISYEIYEWKISGLWVNG